ncbi:MAG TPA: MiaB/RimO family radical SAM methylthiotransferase [Gemmatimonadaceae bacterium]|nr:MiaB/RimO family radical SAM methylthiotransferase [Gemmatimonadaceae bacterium]
MTARVYLRTFGCRANQYDSEIVRSLVASAGGVIVDSPEDATVAVFNSCAVTAAAEADLRRSIRQAARANGELETLVMGCAAARDDGSIAGLPSVRHVVPGAEMPLIAGALGIPAPHLATTGRQTATRALLRIQDGCDEHCTFCATTLARGNNRSRPEQEIIDEALRLAEHHPEIVLTGIHIGSYGSDTGSTLGRLVERLVKEVPVVRFRLSSLEATEVDERLSELFGEPRRLAPHLHAPLQSGSDRLLKRMGRHWYTARSYRQAVEKLAAHNDTFALGADVIAGFPGETQTDHRNTCDLIRDLPFTYLHVFPFSQRPGTAAVRLPEHVDSSVTRARAAELRALGEEKRRAHVAERLGQPADVVVVRGDIREGLTEDYLEARLDSDLPRGTRVDTRLVFRDGRLVATLDNA